MVTPHNTARCYRSALVPATVVFSIHRIAWKPCVVSSSKVSVYSRFQLHSRNMCCKHDSGTT